MQQKEIEVHRYSRNRKTISLVSGLYHGAIVMKFTGNDIEKAHYYEEDKKYLPEFEPDVMHYETFDFSSLSKE